MNCMHHPPIHSLPHITIPDHGNPVDMLTTIFLQLCGPGVLFTKGRTTDIGRTPVVHQNLRRAGYSRNLSYVRSSYSCCQSSVNFTTGVRLSYALRKYVYYCKSRWLFIVYQTFMLD